MIHDHAPFSDFAAGFPCDPSLAASRPLPDDNQNTTQPAGVTPFITLPPLRGARGRAIPHQALDDLAAIRRQQIHDYGHTVAADQALAVPFMVEEACRNGMALREDIQFNKRHLLRRHAVKAAAWFVALADRLDADAGELAHG